MVDIYGGAFAWGGAPLVHEPYILASYVRHKIVYVNLAYRVGLFGFIDFGSDSIVPRNLGLHGKYEGEGGGGAM